MTTTYGPAPQGRVLLREVAALVRPWRAQLIVVVALVVAAALVELVPPLVVRALIDNDLLSGRTADLVLYGALYLVAVALDAALSFAYAYLAARVAQQALAALRVRLFAHLARLETGFFDRTPLGDVISRMTADVDTVDEVFTGGLATLVGQLLSLVAVVGAMVVLSLQLSLVALLVAPPLLLVTRAVQIRVRDAQRATRRAIGLVNAEVAEDVAALSTIRVFAREAVFVARFRRALLAMLEAANRSTFFVGLYAPVTGLLAAVVTATLIYAGAGGWFASAGISFGTLAAFVLLFQRFFAPIIALGDEWQSVQSAVAGAERVLQLLAVPAAHAPDRVRTDGAGIDLRDVTFAYVPGHPVVRDLTLTVAPGEHVAVVGRTAAGKSSLVSLIGGLYAPGRGTVRVAGRDPAGLDEHERRRVIGVVPQTVQLFAGTLRENITLRDPSIDDEACLRAARISGLEAVVRALPAGLDTRIAADRGGAGAALSAGQRQLVSLARALVTNPAVLLLDEATSAIDGATDAAFRTALRRTTREHGQAVLVVAHRLATARDADRVVVMDKGVVVEEGDPRVLADAGGYFAALLELEAAGWDWRDAAPVPTGA